MWSPAFAALWTVYGILWVASVVGAKSYVPASSLGLAAITFAIRSGNESLVVAAAALTTLVTVGFVGNTVIQSNRNDAVDSVFLGAAAALVCAVSSHVVSHVASTALVLGNGLNIASPVWQVAVAGGVGFLGGMLLPSGGGGGLHAVDKSPNGAPDSPRPAPSAETEDPTSISKDDATDLYALLSEFEAVSAQLVATKTSDRQTSEYRGFAVRYKALKLQLNLALEKILPTRSHDHSDVARRNEFEKDIAASMEHYDRFQPLGVADKLRCALLRCALLQNEGATARDIAQAQTAILANVYMRYGQDELAKKTLEETIDVQDWKNAERSASPLIVVNAGCGMGSDMFVQARYLKSAAAGRPFKIIGLELNAEYAGLAAKASEALGLHDCIEVHCADLTRADQVQAALRGRKAAGAYSTLTLLHVPRAAKGAAWSAISSVLQRGAKFRNEDYHCDGKTDVEFASSRIAAHPISKERTYQIASDAGMPVTSWYDATGDFVQFTTERYKRAQGLATSQGKKGVSVQNVAFYGDVARYFKVLGGRGHVVISCRE